MIYYVSENTEQHWFGEVLLSKKKKKKIRKLDTINVSLIKFLLQTAAL